MTKVYGYHLELFSFWKKALIALVVLLAIATSSLFFLKTYLSLGNSIQLIGLFMSILNLFVVSVLTYFLYNIESQRFSIPQFTEQSPFEMDDRVGFPITNIGPGLAENIEITQIIFYQGSEKINVDYEEGWIPFTKKQIQPSETEIIYLKKENIPESVDRVNFFLETRTNQRVLNFDMKSLRNLEE